MTMKGSKSALIDRYATNIFVDLFRAKNEAESRN
jgi:hypothetical protein